MDWGRADLVEERADTTGADTGIGTVETDTIERAIEHLNGLSSAALGRMCQLIREVDSRQSWMSDGARNLTEWVSARLRLRNSTAAQLVRIATRTNDLPHIANALTEGSITIDQADSLTQMATPDDEHLLLEEARHLTNAALDLAARRKRYLGHQDAAGARDRRHLYRQWNLDRSEMRFRGLLAGEAGRRFDAAIDDCISEIPPHPETGLFDPLPTRAADALSDIVGGVGVDTRMTIFVNVDDLLNNVGGVAELDNTAFVTNKVARLLGCDADTRIVTVSDGTPVGVGRRTRRVPGWLKELVYHRDGHRCQFPGCGSTRWLHVHHRQHWADGGRTDLDNLILLCGFHHRFIHEHCWHVTKSGTHWEFRRDDWTLFPGPPLKRADERALTLAAST